MNHYSRNGQIGGTKPSNNVLHRTYINVAFLVTGLDYIQSQHPVLKVELKRFATSLVESFQTKWYIIKRNPSMKPLNETYPLHHSIIGDTIRHNIAHVTSASKNYIP